MPSGPPSPNAGSSPRHRLTWWWQPLPMIPAIGFGMNVANRPSSFATCMQIWRYVTSRSAVSIAGPNWKFISIWPGSS